MTDPPATDLGRELDALGGDVTTALENLLFPAALLDRDGVIRWQNEASKGVRGDIVGSHFADMVASEDVDRAREAFTNMLCRGEPAEFTMHVKGPSGDTVPLDFSSAPVLDGGSVVGIFGLSREAARPRANSSHAPSVALTPRQLDVLRLLGEGKSTHEIAAALGLSTTTVRNHVANLLAALGVHTRLEAVVAARRRGLLEE